MRIGVEINLANGILTALLTPNTHGETWRDIRSGCLFQRRRPYSVQQAIGEHNYITKNGEVSITNGIFQVWPNKDVSEDEIIKEWADCLTKKETELFLKVLMCGIFAKEFSRLDHKLINKYRQLEKCG